MRPSQEHVVSVLRLLMLELSVAYRSPQRMHDVWSVLFWGSGCSAGGIAGTGSALVYDLSLSAELRHDMRCLLIAHVFRHCIACAVVATSSCNRGIIGTGTLVMVMALVPVPVPELILVY